MISALIFALVSHVQVLPQFGAKTQDLQPGAVIYVEPSSDTHLDLSFTHTSTSTGVKLGARWQF